MPPHFADARPTIALISPTAGPLMGRSSAGLFGGREVQTLRLASLLAERYAVRVVLWGTRVARYRHAPGVEVWETPGLPPLPRAAQWRRMRDAVEVGPLAALLSARPAVLTHLVVRELYRRAAWPRRAPAVDRDDVDAVIALGLHTTSADAMFTARRRGHAAMLWLRSDEDVSSVVRPRLGQRDPYGSPGHLQWAALQMADHVLVQNTRQRTLARQQAVRDVTVVPNPLPDDTPTLGRPPECPPGPFVLWVGRVDERHKRPSLALKIAREAPDIPVVMVCNPMDEHPGAFEALRAKAPPNVTLIPRVPFQAIGHLFDDAAVLLSTSSFEGFPNTFLQAARRHVPIVSTTVDPEAMLSAGGAGLVTGDDVAAAARVLTALMSDTAHRNVLGAAGHRWIAERHGAQLIGRRLFGVIDGLLTRRGRR